MRSTGTVTSPSEARAFESLLPDSGLARKHESCRRHGIAEERSIGKLVRVDDEVSVGGEGLVGR